MLKTAFLEKRELLKEIKTEVVKKCLDLDLL